MSENVCTNCGTPAQTEAQFCPKCGMQYGAQAPPPPGAYAPAPPPAGYPPAMPRSTKEKVPAGLLAIFLGTLGVHQFYLGRTGWGIGFLVLSVVTCGWGTIITAPIALIQGIMYLVATDQDFERKYVVEGRFF